LVVDSQPPAPPTDLVVTPLDHALSVSWNPPALATDVVRYRVYATPAAGPEKSVTAEGAHATQAEVDGLDDGVEYAVTVTAFDGAGELGNESARAGIQRGTPRAAVDYLG